MNEDAPFLLHASAVAFGPIGLLITGASGSGKSTLALQLIAIGARLVADDRVTIAKNAEGALFLCAPGALAGKIEARGIGILAAEPVTAIARAMVDLDTIETERVPEPKEIVIAGVALRRYTKVESPAFPAMLRLDLAGY